jgi:hypothetical protein
MPFRRSKPLTMLIDDCVKFLECVLEVEEGKVGSEEGGGEA